MSESGKSVPVEVLVDWYTRENDIHRAQQTEFNARFRDAEGVVHDSDDPDVNRFAGRIIARGEVLRSFAEMITEETAGNASSEQPVDKPE